MYTAYYLHIDSFCRKIGVVKQEDMTKVACGVVNLGRHRKGIKEVKHRCIDNMPMTDTMTPMTAEELELYTGETMEEFYNNALAMQQQEDIAEDE